MGASIPDATDSWDGVTTSAIGMNQRVGKNHGHNHGS